MIRNAEADQPVRLGDVLDVVNEILDGYKDLYTPVTDQYGWHSPWSEMQADMNEQIEGLAK